MPLSDRSSTTPNSCRDAWMYPDQMACENWATMKYMEYSEIKKRITWNNIQWVNTLCLKKVPTFKLSITLSNLNRFSKFLHCWKLNVVWNLLRNPYDITHLTLGMLLHYLEKLKIQFLRHSIYHLTQITQRHKSQAVGGTLRCFQLTTVYLKITWDTIRTVCLRRYYSIRPGQDLDLWPVTLKTFSPISTHVMDICSKSLKTSSLNKEISRHAK